MEDWDPALPVSEFLRSRVEEIETYIVRLNERIEVASRTLATLDDLQQRFVLAQDWTGILALVHEAYQRGYEQGSIHLSETISASMELAKTPIPVRTIQ